MMSSTYSTRVKAPASNLPSHGTIDTLSYDDGVRNSLGRASSDKNSLRKGLARPRKTILFGQLNCRSLSSLSSREELNKHICDYNLSVTCIQEHRQVHRPEDPDIRISSLGSSTIFTSSATRNRQGAAVGGVAITVQTSLLPLLTSISKINDRIMLAIFKGNPKTYVVSCYSPTNTSDEASITGFYKFLNDTIASIPLHALLVIGGDFNAHVARQFSYHSTTNRNGQLLSDFVNRNNLLITNTLFQKSSKKLWTHRSPNKYLSQIDFILCRKRWRNSILDSQAYSTSDPIGSDHRIVCAKIRLSLRSCYGVALRGHRIHIL
ncbi:craniofacial development protein 2-like [Patiria miniata]|uniref:Endonuclease/exonuclease/phosphatase domain-containing protein n=1 Tax=Patiria miniata TaxID=46514 RepID=A0A913ZXP6_PATMI|nr:craniofacial development protein 2-like [Patiria miniata]XP_038055830.1 craniofacial development protein 2-like [Patiria miniata]